MNGSLKVVQGIVLLSFVGLMFSSCGGSQTTLSSETTSGTTTVNPTPTASEGESTAEEEKNATIPSGYSADNLFVTVPDTIDYLNFTSIYGARTSRCSVTTSPVPNDITCTVEVNELALYKDGIKFQYNVPANACKYIGTQPYWYWNSEVGVGPQLVDVNVIKDASGTITSQQCTVDGVGPFACNNEAAYPTAAADIRVDVADEISVKCNYDSSDEAGGINCCFGKYRLRTTVVTPDSTTSTDEKGKEWGGSVESCIGGPARTSWESKSSAGYPNYLIEKMTPNVARTKIYKVEPTIDHIPATYYNIAIANYFTVGNHNHVGYGAASATTSVFPYYVDPVSDRSGTSIGRNLSDLLPMGNPYYIFDCLDEAFEVNFRIRMLVQDWDTVAALQSYISSGVGSADEPGTAPADCPGLAGESCNQLFDADNFVDDQPTGDYSIVVPASRSGYFPKDKYE